MFTLQFLFCLFYSGQVVVQKMRDPRISDGDSCGKTIAVDAFFGVSKCDRLKGGNESERLWQNCECCEALQYLLSLER